MKLHPIDNTDERLDHGDSDDTLAHLFCKDQARSDNATARCGKRKDGWITAAASHPTCIVCFTMMEAGTCAHCMGNT